MALPDGTACPCAPCPRGQLHDPSPARHVHPAPRGPHVDRRDGRRRPAARLPGPVRPPARRDLPRRQLARRPSEGHGAAGRRGDHAGMVAGPDPQLEHARLDRRAAARGGEDRAAGRRRAARSGGGRLHVGEPLQADRRGAAGAARPARGALGAWQLPDRPVHGRVGAGDHERGAPAAARRSRAPSWTRSPTTRRSCCSRTCTTRPPTCTTWPP